ncbi:MAG: hypothetical protein ACRENF_08130 [Thermodesulfobacteriota bacterium]
MSEEIKLGKIITEKIEQLKVDDNVKEFLLEILKFEKSIANLGGNVPYTNDYKKRIETFAPKEEK